MRAGVFGRQDYCRSSADGNSALGARPCDRGYLGSAEADVGELALAEPRELAHAFVVAKPPAQQADQVRQNHSTHPIGLAWKSAVNGFHARNVRLHIALR